MTYPKPATEIIPLRRADRPPSLGLQMLGQNIETGEVVTLPRGDQVISWVVSFPADTQTKTTAPSGGLIIDQDGTIRFPLVQAQLDALPARAVVPYAVQVIEGDGARRTWLTGALELQD